MAPVAEAQTIIVPCSTPAAVTAINTANARSSATLRLSANGIYNITTPATAADGLPVITRNLTIVGGPNTTIRRDPTVVPHLRGRPIRAAQRGGDLHPERKRRRG
jgi:hypothetical protein